MSYPTQQDAYQDRNEAFSQGISGGPVAGSPGLDEDQAQYAASVPQRYAPQGLNQATQLSTNGSSASTASRRIIGGYVMPSPNGSSASSYAASFALQRPSAGVGSGVL